LVGGAGSIAAAGVAVGIAVGGWRRSETRANARDQQVEQLRRRELASAFGVWVEPDETGLTAEIKSVNGGPLPMCNVELMLFRVRETGRDGVIVLDIEERQHVDIGTVGPTAGTVTHRESTIAFMGSIKDRARLLTVACTRTIPSAHY
jgi:hypothetical protein